MVKKCICKKVSGIGAALILLGGLTACASHKPADDPSASVTQVQTGSVTSADSEEHNDSGLAKGTVGTDDMGKPDNPSADTAPRQDLEDQKSDDEARKAAYVRVLKDIYSSHIFPDGKDYGFEDNFDISNNQFAVYDIDMDGRDELMISYTTTFMAGMVGIIYDYDSASDTVRKEFLEFPALKFYDNGTVEAEASHNQGMAGEGFWPYTLYQYNKETDAYDQVGIIDAWDQSFAEEDYDGNPFPSHIDVSGTGIVYYIMEGGTYERDTPVDQEEYNQWRNSHVGDAGQMAIPYMNLTEENINSIL